MTGERHSCSTKFNETAGAAKSEIDQQIKSKKISNSLYFSFDYTVLIAMPIE